MSLPCGAAASAEERDVFRSGSLLPGFRCCFARTRGCVVYVFSPARSCACVPYVRLVHGRRNTNVLLLLHFNTIIYARPFDHRNFPSHRRRRRRRPDTLTAHVSCKTGLRVPPSPTCGQGHYCGRPCSTIRHGGGAGLSVQNKRRMYNVERTNTLFGFRPYTGRR